MPRVPPSPLIREKGILKVILSWDGWQGWEPLHQPLLTAQHGQLEPSSSSPWVPLQVVFLPHALNARPAILSSIRKED